MPATASPLAAQPAEPSSLRERIVFHIKVARPGLWLTSIWFYLLPLGGKHVFTSPQFWLGVFFVTFPMGHLIYGWNDLMDAEADRLNPRKGTFLFGARGTPEQLRSLPWQMALVQLPFLLLFTWLLGGRGIVYYTAIICVTALYNVPRIGWKNHPPLEILNQAGYLLVFVLSSWLNGVAKLSAPAMLFGALFAMHSHVFGEIMDIVPDRDAGRRTTANMIGLVPSKMLVVALLITESVIVYRSIHDVFIMAFLITSAAFFLIDAIILWRDRIYSPSQMRFAMLAWNVVALASMPYVWWSASFVRTLY